MKVVIPDTAQWQRIRHKWRAPEFIISAVSSKREIAYCLADLKMRIEVQQQGKALHTEISYPAYGYSTDCEGSSLRFEAAPGTELQVVILAPEQRPLPSGEVIVVGYWPYTKDKLVGNALDTELRPFAMAASIFGLVLIALAVQLRRQLTVRR